MNKKDQPANGMSPCIVQIYAHTCICLPVCECDLLGGSKHQCLFLRKGIRTRQTALKQRLGTQSQCPFGQFYPAGLFLCHFYMSQIHIYNVLLRMRPFSARPGSILPCRYILRLSEVVLFLKIRTPNAGLTPNYRARILHRLTSASAAATVMQGPGQSHLFPHACNGRTCTL